MDICKKKNIPLKEEEFTLFNLYDADECFLTGTAAEAIAVTKVDGRTIGSGKCGKVTRAILEGFAEFTNDKNYGYEIYK